MKKDDINSIKLGMTREEVFGILGAPEDWNRGSRKYPRSTTYKYTIDGTSCIDGWEVPNEVELYFQYSKDGGLLMVMEQPSHKILLGGL